jgi:hypothetical protein
MQLFWGTWVPWDRFTPGMWYQEVFQFFHRWHCPLTHRNRPMKTLTSHYYCIVCFKHLWGFVVLWVGSLTLLPTSSGENENEGTVSLQNVGNRLPGCVHGVIIQKTTMLLFSPVKTLNVSQWLCVVLYKYKLILMLWITGGLADSSCLLQSELSFFHYAVLHVC